MTKTKYVKWKSLCWYFVCLTVSEGDEVWFVKVCVFVYDGIKVAPITQTSVWWRRFLTFPLLLMYPIIPSNSHTSRVWGETLNISSLIGLFNNSQWRKRRIWVLIWCSHSYMSSNSLEVSSQSWGSACDGFDHRRHVCVCVWTHTRWVVWLFLPIFRCLWCRRHRHGQQRRPRLPSLPQWCCLHLCFR